MEEEFKTILNRAIIGTKYNHPDFNMGYVITAGIIANIEGCLEGNVKKQNLFFNYFSGTHKYYGIPLRTPIYNYSTLKNTNISLIVLDFLFKYCHEALNKDKLSDSNSKALANYYVHYLNIVRSIDSSLQTKDNAIQNYGDTIIKHLLPYLTDAMNVYINSIDITKTFMFSSIKNIKTTKTGKSVLSSCDNLEMKNSFNGKLLNGKITIASEKGYLTRVHKKQEDCVLSMAKSEDCFINVIADGAGGSLNGALASKTTIEFLKKWYESLDINTIESSSLDTIAHEINKQLEIINNYINQNIKGAYTTVVIAFTFNGQTLISNVGDSTAYAFDSSKDSLIELTKLDSPSSGLSYEDARHNPYNNIINQAIGQDEPLKVHHSAIMNRNNRIILSSDGVTDLVSEENFKSFFRNNNSADEIVNKAVYNTDKFPEITKTEDNSSAIVIELPEKIVLNTGRKM